MIRKINLRNRTEVFALLDIQSLSYVIEARLIGFHNIPPLNDTFSTLRRSDETFFGYFIDHHRLVGAVSYKRDGDVLDIHRLMVHPDYFRRGIARSLLAFIEQVEAGVHTIVVKTGTKNVPAINLYKQCGFVEIDEKLIAPGISMTHFKKRLEN